MSSARHGLSVAPTPEVPVVTPSALAADELRWVAARVAAGEPTGDDSALVEVIREAEVVPRLQFEDRWPSYVPRAVALGVRSHPSVKLTLDGEATSGSLNLYSTTAEDVSREAEAVVDEDGSS